MLIYTEQHFPSSLVALLLPLLEDVLQCTSSAASTYYDSINYGVFHLFFAGGVAFGSSSSHFWSSKTQKVYCLPWTSSAASAYYNRINYGVFHTFFATWDGILWQH